MSNSASSNAMSSSTSSTPASSFSNKSCYRLYAGHGNWINLNAKTTQDLLNIFAKGEPCRYQLATGLFIDIIPNDVDCNSKNIDMVGLMRADLVYEPQMMENHVQQLMSHYIRSLLDEQGIIDAFPPLRQGEDLPIVTSLPTHRHLSLVPSVVGAVRRGPKSTTGSSSAAQQQRKAVSSSSSSSVTLPDEDPLALSSSSSSLDAHGSLGLSNVGSANNRKRALNSSSGGGGSVTTRRSHLKRGRQNSDNVDSIELLSQHHHPKRHMMSLELPNLNTGAVAAAAAAAAAATTATHSVFSTNNAASLGMSPFMDHTAHHGQGGLIGFHHHHHHHQPTQQQQQQGSGFWLSSYQNSPMPTNNRSSSAGGFNFEFGMDFDHTTLQQQQQQQQQHKQSPTDILHDYDMSHQMMSNDLYSNNNTTAAVVTAANTAVTHMHPHQHHVDHSHLLNDNQQQQQHMMTTASCSDTTSLESFVPASPIPTNWLDTTHHQHLQQQQQQQPRENGHWQQQQHHYSPSSTTTAADSKTTALTTATASLDTNDLKKLKFEYNNTTVEDATTTKTTLPLVDFEGDNTGSNNNNNNSNHGNDDSKDQIFLTHVDALSSSPSTSFSSSSPTTTSQ